MNKSDIFSALSADPSNRRLRLIFADWLEENGNPLCEEWRKPPLRTRVAIEHKDPAIMPIFEPEFLAIAGNGAGNGMKNNNTDHIFDIIRLSEGDGYGAGSDGVVSFISEAGFAGGGFGNGFWDEKGAGCSGYYTGDGGTASFTTTTVFSGNSLL